MQNFKLKSFDGTELYCYLWDDVENAKGIVQIVHGMGEHAGRYGHFAEFLNKNGYIAFGDDHRAHGLTESDENRGHHDGDIFADTVRDEIFIHDWLKQKYENLPTLLLGHSYGSFLGQSFLQQGTDIKGVALTGSGTMSSIQTGAGMAATKFIMLFKKSARLGFLNGVSKFTYDSKYKDDSGDKLWLTRDRAFRDISIADPNSGVNMSASFCHYLLKGVRDAAKLENMAKLQKSTPIGLFSGSMDPIGGYGKSIGELYNMYKAAEVEHLEYHLYEDARHEVLNEINRDEVFEDILKFFDCCIAK